MIYTKRAHSCENRLAERMRGIDGAGAPLRRRAPNCGDSAPSQALDMTVGTELPCESPIPTVIRAGALAGASRCYGSVIVFV